MAQVAKPPGFSWVEEGMMAAHGLPVENEQWQFIVDNGVIYVISLTETLPKQLQDFPQIKSIHIPIVDFHSPSLEQINFFIREIERIRDNKEACSLHCKLGHGRTGTLIACYFVFKNKMGAEEAIQEIRRIRPGSIETRNQEQTIRDFAKHTAEKRNHYGEDMDHTKLEPYSAFNIS